MEFTNEIFFNKPLTAGSTVIITYCGKLYREHSKDIAIVYGYGDNWEYTDSTPMVETENGFEVTITLKDYNTFNFCFTNSFNIWDNNSGFNYISPISPKQIETSNNDQSIKEEITNTDNTNTTNNTNDDNNIEETDSESEKSIDNEESTETQGTNENNFEDTTQEDIESAFTSLLDSLLDDTKENNETVNVSDLPVFGLQSIDQINELDTVNCDDIFSKLFDDLTEDPKQEVTVQDETVVEQPTEVELEEEKSTDYDNYDIEELDVLMDNLLTSISENSQVSEYATPISKVENSKEEQDLTNEKVGLPIIQTKEDWVDKIINISYNFTKKITTACKKFGMLIKLKAKKYGLISDNKR